MFKLVVKGHEERDGHQLVTLGGVALRDGDRVEVSWPDGSITPHVVTVTLGQATINWGHNDRTTVATSEASILVHHNGRHVHVDLVGMSARFQDPNKTP